jgi:hypothetical protein
MMKLLPLTALALSLSGGVALADHRGGDHRGSYEHRGASQVVVRDHRDWHGNGGYIRERHDVHGGWNGGGRVVFRNDGYRHDGYRNDGYRYVSRRPIYVSRPIIRERYYNYYRRPALIVESYNTMPGYYWVAGTWTWDGAEWIWQPGHYEPDQSYVDPGYGPGYDSGY